MVYCLNYLNAKMQVYIGQEPDFIYRESLLGCLLYNMEQDGYDKEYIMSTIKQLRTQIPRKCEYNSTYNYMSIDSAKDFRDYYKEHYNPYYAKKYFKKLPSIYWC